MDCALVRNHLDAYVDGELEPTPVIELEGHLRACAPCRDEATLAQAMKRGVQSIPRPALLPEARARVLSALDDRGAGERKRASRGATAAMVLAAAVLLGLVATQRPGDPPTAAGAPMVQWPQQAVKYLHGDLPVGAASPDQVVKVLSRKVGFRVPPVHFGSPDVRLSLAREERFDEGRPAARLDYSVGQQRLTMFVLQSMDEQAQERPGGKRVRIGKHEATAYIVNGYPVLMLERGGLTYMFTGDLDEQQLLRLLSAAQL